MATLTGIRDLNLRMLEDFDDETLFNYCITNKAASELCNNEIFWQRRFMQKFVDRQEEWKGEKTWKEYYLLLTHYYDVIEGYINPADTNDQHEILIVENKTKYNMCTYYNGKELFHLMWKLRYLSRSNAKIPPITERNKESVIERLERKYMLDFRNFSETKLKFYYMWSYILLKEGDQCRILHHFLKKYNIITYDSRIFHMLPFMLDPDNFESP